MFRVKGKTMRTKTCRNLLLLLPRRSPRPQLRQLGWLPMSALLSLLVAILVAPSAQSSGCQAPVTLPSSAQSWWMLHWCHRRTGLCIYLYSCMIEVNNCALARTMLVQLHCHRANNNTCTVLASTAPSPMLADAATSALLVPYWILVHHESLVWIKSIYLSVMTQSLLFVLGSSFQTHPACCAITVRLCCSIKVQLK